MPGPPFEIVADYLRRASAAQPADSDAELLHRYVDRRDEDAFAELVRRHGPMVLGACRRILGPGPDADDAFQAAFLALARGAGRVRSTVPGWLYRVAVRAARAALPPHRRPHPRPKPRTRPTRSRQSNRATSAGLSTKS